MPRKALLALILLASMLYGGAVRAQEPPSAPIYNPYTKSYFQLFNDNLRPGNWMAARSRASTKVFKGVRGRLAVVDKIGTHDFLVAKLGLRQRKLNVWIGLRYWCKTRMLQWEGQRAYSPTDTDHFRLWHSQWARASDEKGGASGMISTCEMDASLKQGFAPVYYVNIGGVVRWQATGAAKYFDSYLVEYVTKGE